MSKMKIGYGLSIAALTFTFLTGKVVAAELLVVQVDKTQIISLSEEPGIVVVGNPSMADVSVNGKHVFVHGHSFGDTNLIIIDKNGNQLANFDLTVQHNSSNALAMYKAGNRTSYTCAPLCEITMQPGDPLEYVQKVISTNQAKLDFATGRKPDPAAPSQAQ
jgi:hypothetical protein